MHQSWDMEQIISIPHPKEGMLRIFQKPEKSNDFGRV
jgi:hypothetical protein